MATSLDTAKTIKYSCQQYTRFCDDSSRMQHITTSFVSALRTSVMLFPDPSSLPSVFLTKEIDEVKENVYDLMNRLKKNLENELSVILEVNKYVETMSVEFRKMIDLMKYENERSNFTLLQLENQRKIKDKEILDCSTCLENEKLKQLQEEWIKQHYISNGTNFTEVNSGSYMKLLKELRHKIELQINFEKEEMESISRNILIKLKDFKCKVVEAWNLIDPHIKNCKERVHETKNQEKYTDLQKEYLKKEKRIDGFEFNQLNEIKRKLGLLEEANISESREYLSYSRSQSRERYFEESEVVGMFHLG